MLTKAFVCLMSNTVKIGILGKQPFSCLIHFYKFSATIAPVFSVA